MELAGGVAIYQFYLKSAKAVRDQARADCVVEMSIDGYCPCGLAWGIHLGEDHTIKKGDPKAAPSRYRRQLSLTDMSLTVLAADPGAGLTDEVVTSRIGIA